MSTYDDALAILAKDDEEEKNWRSAKGQTRELLLAAKEAKADVEKSAQQKQALQAAIAHLSEEKANLEQSVRRIQQTLANHKTELDEKKRLQDEALAVGRAEIAAQKQTLAALKADLDALRTKFVVG